MNVFAQLAVRVAMIGIFGAQCVPTGMQIGMATLHNAMPGIIDANPQLQCEDCDGYIATRNCEYGTEYLVTVERAGSWRLVSVADCLAPQHKVSTQAEFRRQYGSPWIVDIDKRLWHDWQLPERPLHAVMLRCAS